MSEFERKKIIVNIPKNISKEVLDLFDMIQSSFSEEDYNMFTEEEKKALDFLTNIVDKHIGKSYRMTKKEKSEAAKIKFPV